jgi:hypothetical protein
LPNGKHSLKKLPREQWCTFLPNSHEAYISLEEYEKNQKQLLINAKSYGVERLNTPPREGPALLQGIVVCGRCGKRMTIQYHTRTSGITHPIYVCQRLAVDRAERPCQTIPGTGIDGAISDLLLESMTPLALEVALNVQLNMETRLKEADLIRKQRVERIQYEAELARQRYMQVDSRNRLVADSLEADWNEKLIAVMDAQEEYGRQRESDAQQLTAAQKEQILSLSTDFPKLWNDPNTPDREKKRMVRLILEDVTLTRDDKKISVGIRFVGGATRILALPLPTSAFMGRKTRPEVVEEVDVLLEHHYDAQIAGILNSRGIQTGNKVPFTTAAVGRIRATYQLKGRFERLRERGMLTRDEMLEGLRITGYFLKKLQRNGLIKTHSYGSSTINILYEPTDEALFAELREHNQNRRNGDQATQHKTSHEV